MEVIFSHGDTDGICSAAILCSVNPKAELWITTPVGLLKDLKACDAERVYICDIAISERDREALMAEFTRISGVGELTYIDHHPLPLHMLTSDLPCNKVVWDAKKSTSELAYRFLDRNTKSHIALFGAIADYLDETDFVTREFGYYDKRTIYFEAGLLAQSLGAVMGDYGFKREVIRGLAEGKMPSSMPRVVDLAVSISEKEWKLYDYVKKRVRKVDGIAVVDAQNGLSPTKAAKFAVGAADLPVGICTQPRDDHVDISVRKRADVTLDLNHALRIIAPRLGGSGGGHESAAGARVPKDKLNEFIRMLSKEVHAAL